MPQPCKVLVQSTFSRWPTATGMRHFVSFSAPIAFAGTFAWMTLTACHCQSVLPWPCSLPSYFFGWVLSLFRRRLKKSLTLCNTSMGEAQRSLNLLNKLEWSNGMSPRP